MSYRLRVFTHYPTTLAYFICIIFFFNDTATTEIYTLSLHDALPICSGAGGGTDCLSRHVAALAGKATTGDFGRRSDCPGGTWREDRCPGGRNTFSGAGFEHLAQHGRRCGRSEEHTSELQSPCNLVCR